VLSNVDRELLQRCLNGTSGGWEDFVNRFLGLVVHVVNDTASARSLRLPENVREDLVSDVFYALIRKEFAVLRRFRGKSSLATYLTVVARRIVIREIIRRKISSQPLPLDIVDDSTLGDFVTSENREAIEAALAKLPAKEADAVRMFHFQGRSYREIGASLSLDPNSVGPYLSRARARMREELSN
jgi:RNA polymerase sigma-70 factor (ECF subfamily)